MADQSAPRGRGLVAVLFASALAITACTSILGDFVLGPSDGGASARPDVGSPTGGSSDASMDPPPDAGCTPNETICQDLYVYTCDAGTFTKAAKPCPFACTDGQCAGECKPGSTKCDFGDGGAQQMPSQSTCGKDAMWGAPSVCPNACFDPNATDAGIVNPNSHGGSCTGICAPNDKRCVGTAVQVCNSAGVFTSVSQCPYLCTDGVCTGECDPLAGVDRCNGNQPQTCSEGGAWVNSNDGKPCSSGFCVGGDCKVSCPTGATQCNGNIPQTCVNGASWVNGMPCDKGCQMGACTDCTPGTTLCLQPTGGNALQTCGPDGKWVLSACPSVCKGTVCTGACPPGTARCNGATFERCTPDGNWLGQQTCFQPFVCDVAAGGCR
jgi:hypothetical protein